LGEKLAPDQDGLLYADIDLGMISVAKAAADPAGHYSRPDVTRLLFNNRSARPVEHFALPAEQMKTPEADAMPDPSSIQ
jgi:aliphatic nitrilase